MSWKKSTPYFVWQSIWYAKSWKHFSLIWSYYGRWRASFQNNRTSIKDELPWINFPALDYLSKNLSSEFKVFEFGGGGSTLFFCNIVAEVSTVDHDEVWFQVLTNKIKEKGINNWKGFFIKPEQVDHNRSRLPENPEDFMSSSNGFRKMTFEKYARAINQFPLAYFDVVLVDGRARPSCIQQALPHIKSGGLLVVDNTERAYYLSAFQDKINTNFKSELEMHAPCPYSPDFTQTSIFRVV